MANHKERQIARIVEATLQLMHEGGLSRVTISKVALAAGMTRQTIYNYFPDVESIIARAMDDHSAAVEHHLLAVIEGAEGLFQKLRAFADFQISHTSPEHEGFALDSGLSAELRARLANHTNAVKAALEQAIISGDDDAQIAKGLNPAVAAELLWGMVEGGMNASLRHPDQKPYLIQAVVQAMVAALGPQTGPGNE